MKWVQGEDEKEKERGRQAKERERERERSKGSLVTTCGVNYQTERPIKYKGKFNCKQIIEP